MKYAFSKSANFACFYKLHLIIDAVKLYKDKMVILLTSFSFVCLGTGTEENLFSI